MGKISKTPSEKHEANLSIQFRAFILTGEKLSLVRLSGHLAQFPSRWNHPRGDLYNWIPLLNRFDEILEKFVQWYQLHLGPQTTPFGNQFVLAEYVEGRVVADDLERPNLADDVDRVLIKRILDFTRLLIENCGNRSLYSSSSHLSHLLNTSSPSILEATLRLGHRLSQRYSASRLRINAPWLGPVNQGLLSAHYMLDLDRLEKIALPFVKSINSHSKDASKVKETGKGTIVSPAYAPDLTYLVQPDIDAKELVDNFGGAWINYYEGAENNHSAPPSPLSIQNQGSVPNGSAIKPSPSAYMSSQNTSDQKSGFKLYEISNESMQASSLEDLAKNHLSSVPESCRYELFQRMRTSKAMQQIDAVRRQMVGIRILAIMNLSHIYPENQLQEKIFKYETDLPRRAQLPNQLCELLHPPGDEPFIVPKRLQSLAMMTLEAFTMHKNKSSEGAYALSVNASHGVLTYVARRSVAELADGSPEDTEDTEWRESFFALIHMLPKTSPRLGDSFVSSGLVDILVEGLRYRTFKAQCNFPRLLNFIDVFIFNAREAFNSLVNAKGLDAISELMASQVEKARATFNAGEGTPDHERSYVMDYQIAFEEYQTLRALFKMIKNMMSLNAGPFDRLLRNLIESSELLGALKTVVEHPSIYGSSIWSAAVEIFTSFIHFEPTSYSAIAEAGLTRAFLDTIVHQPNSGPDHDRPSEAFSGLNSTSFLIPASVEAIQAIPPAFGALSLVDAGRAQLDESNALNTFFSIFASRTHVRALTNASQQDQELLGRAFDELARHNPGTLRQKICKRVALVTDQIAQRSCSSYYTGKSGVKLFHTSNDDKREPIPETEDTLPSTYAAYEPLTAALRGDGAGKADVEMQDAGEPHTTATADAATQTTNSHSLEPLQDLEVFSSFLIGFFSGSNLCGPFADAHGVEPLIGILTSPGLPSSGSSIRSVKGKMIHIVQLFMENKTTLVVPLLVEKLRQALDELQTFSDSHYHEPFFAEYVTENRTPLSRAANGRPGSITLRRLMRVQILLQVFSKNFPSSSAHHKPNPLGVLNLTDVWLDIIDRLGLLLRRCALEIANLAGLSHKSVPVEEKANGNSAISPRGPFNPDTVGLANPSELLMSDGAGGNHLTSSDAEQTAEKRNLPMIRGVMQLVFTWSIAFYAHLVKSLVPRRMPSDPFVKQGSFFVADRIALTLKETLQFGKTLEFPPRAFSCYRALSFYLLFNALTEKKTDYMERASGASVLTFLVDMFKRRGGFDVLVELTHELTKSILEAPSEDVKSSMISVVGWKPPVAYDFEAIQAVVRLFSFLTSHKIINDSYQTTTMMSRASDWNKNDHFVQGQFMVEMRSYALTALTPMWSSDCVEICRLTAVKSLCAVMQSVLEADSEVSALQKADQAQPRSEWTFVKWQPRSEETLSRLIEERNVPRDLAMEAIYRGGNLNVVIQEYCTLHMRNPRLPRFPIPERDAPESNAGPSTAANDPELPSQSGEDGSTGDQSPGSLVRSLFGQAIDAPSLMPHDLSLDALPSAPAAIAAKEKPSYRLVDVSQPISVEELDGQRAKIRAELIDRCITVLNSFEAISFELADLIEASANKVGDSASFREDVVTTLVQSLLSFQDGEESDDNSQKISSCAHLLGILFQSREMFDAAQATLKDSFPGLVTFLTYHSGEHSLSAAARSHILLILERVLSEDAQPRTIVWNAQNPEQPSLEALAQLPSSFISPEDKMTLFEAVIESLPHVGKDSNLGLSMVRILVHLTRNRKIAVQLGKRKNMQKLFVMVKQLSGLVNEAIHGSLLITLRQVIEDEETTRQIMATGIRTFLQKQTRHADTTTYTRQLYHLVLRDPEMFISVTNELVKLSKYDKNQSPQHIVLKPDETSIATDAAPKESEEKMDDRPDDAKPSTEASMELERTKTSEMKLPVVSNPDGVIHFLLSELLSYKDVEDRSFPPATPKAEKGDQGDVEMTSEGREGTESNNADNEQKASSKSTDFKPEDHPIYLYRCFLLTCLTELLHSYNRTKIEFINFSRKSDPQAATPSKPRSGVLNYLLYSLVPTGCIQHATDDIQKKKINTSNWAIQVIVSLCLRTSEKGDKQQRDRLDKEDEPELLLVRRFVLEHALKAYRDAASSTESSEMRFSRLLCLSDLFSRMLAGKPISNSSRFNRPPDYREEAMVPSQKQIARLMFERHFISALTNSISEIDLSIPGANRAVKYVLRPLKLLTYTAIELSVSSDPSVTSVQSEDDAISSATSVSDDERENREETPDLFRHSTLGMFEPGRDEDSSSEDSEDEDEDEDMYGDEYADDMEFDEDRDPDEVISDDDDEDMIEGGPIEGLPGDVGMEVEIEIDDDDDDEDDSDEDSSDMHDHDSSMGSDVDDEDGEDHDSADIQLLDPLSGEEDEDDSIVDEEAAWHDETGGIPELANMRDPRAEVIPHEDTSVSGESQSPGIDVDDEFGDHDHEHIIELEHEHEEVVDDDSDGEDPEDDDEEDELDELEASYDDPALGDEDEGEVPPFTWGWPPMAGRRRHSLSQHRHGWPHIMQSYPPEPPMGVPSLRAQGRHGAVRQDNDGTNPLLNRTRQMMNTDMRVHPNRRTHTEHLPPAITDLGRHLAALGGGGMFNIHQLMNTISNGRGFPIGVHQHPGGGFSVTMRTTAGASEFGNQQDPSEPYRMLDAGSSRHHHHSRSNRADPFSATAFNILRTEHRWDEAARLIFGTAYTEKSQNVINTILRLLVPPAIEAERQQEQERERQRKLEEEARKQKEKEENERLEREAKEAEERAAQELEAARLAAQETEQEVSEQQDGESDAMDGVEHTSPVQPPEEADTENVEPTERIFTEIRGNRLDITDLGIDVTYLEALPDEMREEVIMQVFTQQRSEAAAAGQPPNAQLSVFLEQLPTDLREEILAQEMQDRRRREREDARRQARDEGTPAQPEEMDNASFFASLDPVLRQTVLAEAGEEMLDALPPDIAAEARQLGLHHRRRVIDADQLFGTLGMQSRGQDSTSRTGQAAPEKPKFQRRPIVQMLDKAGVATLLRLLFMNHGNSSKANTYGIMRNASGNRQTRTELLGGILMILQEGTLNPAALERCFTQLSSRAKVVGPPKTPTSAKKAQFASALGSDTSPAVVIGYCLGALAFLAHSVTHLPHYFLTEHDSGATIATKGSKKGKGKELSAMKYPINALLALLDRSMVLENVQLMEQMAGLLARITDTLNSILKKGKEETKKADGNDQAVTSESTEQATPQNAPTESATTAAAEATGGDTAEVENTEVERAEPSKKANEPAKTQKTIKPPEIPPESLKLVINILTTRECSSHTFKDTLSTLTNLSLLPNAKDIFGQELMKQARAFSESICESLQQLEKSLEEAKDEMHAQSLALAGFSPTGSDQAKLNRLLTALDYMFDANSAKDEPHAKDPLLEFYEDRTFMSLWHRLSSCLSATERGDKYYFNVATILLPLVEALMVACKRIPSRDNQHLKTPRQEAPASEFGLRRVFFSFTNNHRKILNDLVRHNPKLMSGSFSVLVKNSGVLEFDNKRNYFNRRLHHRTSDTRQYPHPTLQLNIRRDQVFLDSYKCLHFKSPEEIKYGKLNVRFHNEEGVDAGGVTREWFSVLSRQMFNADYALFNPVASDRTTFHPNRLSNVNQEHLQFFKFIGRIIGKALYENRVLDCHFSRAVYKRILRQPVSMKDMETVDLEYTKNMEWMLNNDITDIITETFSVAEDNFGREEVIDLIPNGRNVVVTEENKHEFVRLVIEYRLTGSVNEQLESFLRGFHDIVPPELISIFDEGELELLISGMPEVDVDDWKENTEYHNYTTSSPQIQWFWRAVRSFDKEERARLLQFVTGTGKVPLNGFKELEGMNGFTRFNIHKDYGNKDRLPSSHTCFNQLDLPEYENYEQLRKGLYTAMTTGNEHFGFA